MRPLHAKQPSRAALLSVCGHGVLLALLTLVGTDDRPISNEGSFINAVIVPSAAERPAAPFTEAAAATEGEASREPAPAAPPTPRAREQRVVHTPAPTVEPPEPAPPTSPPEAESASAPAAVVEVVPSPTEPVQVVAETVARAEAADIAPSVAAPSGPHRTLEPEEADALRRRLSSWTGRFAADAPETMTWRENAERYTAVFRPLGAADAMGMEHLAVEVTTERGGERLVTDLRMTRLAFSNFGQFVNRWDPDVGIHDDVIDGRFHSNTSFVVHRTGRKTPVFNGRVTVADTRDLSTAGDGTGHLNRRKMFPAGIETRVRRITLPERAFASASTPQSQRFERDTALTFHADGSVAWRALDTVADESRRDLGDEPFYLIAADEVALHVHGTVDGKVLVYSPSRIVITGDLYYAGDPRAPHADDYLGLVTEGTLEIAEPEITGPGDLEIYASIYARHRFAVRRFRSQHSGTLLIHGSLTAGTLTATEPRYGTRIEFDNRLTTMRAPGFPLSDRYELDSASGEWRVVTTQ
jgi:hypothetical protein